MSIHNILVPNNLDIFARSITCDNIEVDSVSIDNFPITNVAAQHFPNVVGKYASGGVLGADVPGSGIPINIQRFNGVVFIHINANGGLANSSGGDAFIAFPLVGLDPSIIISANSNQLAVVRQLSGSNIGKWKILYFAGVPALVLYPVAANESMFFSNGATGISWDQGLYTFPI